MAAPIFNDGAAAIITVTTGKKTLFGLVAATLKALPPRFQVQE
jgi:hypothetical protein